MLSFHTFFLLQDVTTLRCQTLSHGCELSSETLWYWTLSWQHHVRPPITLYLFKQPYLFMCSWLSSDELLACSASLILREQSSLMFSGLGRAAVFSACFYKLCFLLLLTWGLHRLTALMDFQDHPDRVFLVPSPYTSCYCCFHVPFCFYCSCLMSLPVTVLIIWINIYIHTQTCIFLFYYFFFDCMFWFCWKWTVTFKETLLGGSQDSAPQSPLLSLFSSVQSFQVW